MGKDHNVEVHVVQSCLTSVVCSLKAIGKNNLVNIWHFEILLGTTTISVADPDPVFLIRPDP